MTIKNNVAFNEVAAIEAVKIFKNHFKENKSKAIVSYPDIITYGSHEYFIYMFYSCMLDYGMKSIMYHNNLIKTYLKYPDIFNPLYVLSHPLELDNILKNEIHVRYPNVAKTKWINLSEFLSKENDLKERVVSFSSYQELSDYVDGIHEYGQKTGGLLKRVIADAIGKYYVDEIPIDRHDIEISYLVSVTSSLDLSNKDIKKLSSVWVQASKKEGVDSSLVDQYLWTVGVEFCNLKACNKCPLKDICKKKYKGDNNERDISKF